MKILFLTVSSKKHEHPGLITIDRCDLTRKLDCLNTWVPEVLEDGNDVVFFEGGYDSLFYDKDHLTLQLDELDDYEEAPYPSRLITKVIKTFTWALENKDFDYVYLHDDDIYINWQQFKNLKLDCDFHGGSLGGNGFFFTKKGMKFLLECQHDNYLISQSQADKIIVGQMMKGSDITRNSDMSNHAPFYLPGELYSTVHYVSGRRSYFLNNILRYYNENGITNRKIIMGFPFYSEKRNEFITYETEKRTKTKRDYDFVFDKNGWEYHMGYCKSIVPHPDLLKKFWPYAKKATKYFVINLDYFLNFTYYSDYDFISYLINSCEESLISKENLFVCSESVPKNLDLTGWVLCNEVKEKLKLNFEKLNDYNFYKKS